MTGGLGRDRRRAIVGASRAARSPRPESPDGEPLGGGGGGGAGGGALEFHLEGAQADEQDRARFDGIRRRLGQARFFVKASITASGSASRPSLLRVPESIARFDGFGAAAQRPDL